MNFWKSFIIEEVVSLKSREKIIALLSQDNTLSAIALARRNPQSRGKTDCQAESGRGTPTNRIGQRRILVGGRKNGLIFLEGAQFAVCLFLGVSKNISPMEYQNSIQTGSILLSVCCFSSGCFYIDFSVSRLFPLPSASIVQT